MRSLMFCTAQPILFRCSNRDELDGQDMYHIWGRGEVHTGFWLGNLTERDRLGDPRR